MRERELVVGDEMFLYLIDELTGEPVRTTDDESYPLRITRRSGEVEKLLPAMQAGMSALMLSMGLSLTPADLRRALASPREIVLNAALCFGAMPLVAVALSHALSLPAATAAGALQQGAVFRTPCGCRQQRGAAESLSRRRHLAGRPRVTPASRPCALATELA